MTYDRCEYVPQPQTPHALQQRGMSAGDKLAWMDKYSCRINALWGVGDPRGRRSRACTTHLAAVAQYHSLPTMVWALGMQDPRHPIQDEIDAVKRDRDAAEEARKEVAQQRDELHLIIREVARSLDGVVAPSDMSIQMRSALSFAAM